MIELSGRRITGVKKMSERSTKEFKALVEAVDSCGEQPVRLNLADLNISTLWHKDAFIKLAMRPNLTLILDPETASVVSSYVIVAGGKANYEVRKLVIESKKEDPRIQEQGMAYAALAYVKNGFIRFNLRDTGLGTVSSIGLSGQCVKRVIKIIAQKAAKLSLKLLVDFTDICFEGGCDIVLAEALVNCHKQYKILVSVIGEDSIAEYVRVAGNVRLPAENKARYFRHIQPNTVLRLNTYRSALKSDIAGRKGSGVLSGTTFVLFRGVEGTDALYDEVPIQQLYLPEDLEVFGETRVKGDIRIPRRRNLAELGLQNVCTGSHGHFASLSNNESYLISDGMGGIREVSELYFVTRGLEALDLTFN